MGRRGHWPTGLSVAPLVGLDVMSEPEADRDEQVGLLAVHLLGQALPFPLGSGPETWYAARAAPRRDRLLILDVNGPQVGIDFDCLTGLDLSCSFKDVHHNWNTVLASDNCRMGQARPTVDHHALDHGKNV